MRHNYTIHSFDFCFVFSPPPSSPKEKIWGDFTKSPLWTLQIPTTATTLAAFSGEKARGFTIPIGFVLCFWLGGWSIVDLSTRVFLWSWAFCVDEVEGLELVLFRSWLCGLVLILCASGLCESLFGGCF